ncbi:hypothetical protein [Aliivibrio kagoshimensis]|uniref:hypothetical protein n=1 Tax=Aliivibrio kagoshimensis TaxID=2910230 RepID=UPI003D147CDE
MLWIDIFANLALATFVLLKTESYLYFCLFVFCYIIVTIAVYVYEESWFNTSRNPFVWIIKDVTGLGLTLLLHWLIETFSNITQKIAELGYSISKGDKESIERAGKAVQDTLLPDPESVNLQLEHIDTVITDLASYNGLFGYSAIQMTLLVYLLVKIIWIIIYFVKK